MAMSHYRHEIDEGCIEYQGVVMTLSVKRFTALLALPLVLGIGLTYAAPDSLIQTPVLNQTDNTWGVNLTFGENEHAAFQQTYTVNLCTNGYACPASHEALKVVVKMPILPIARIFINGNSIATYGYTNGDESRVPILLYENLSFGLIAKIASGKPSDIDPILASTTLELSLRSAPYFGSTMEVNPTEDGFTPCGDRLSVGNFGTLLNLAFKTPNDAEVLPMNITSVDVGCGMDRADLALFFNLDEPDDGLLKDNRYELRVFDTEGQPQAHFPLLRLQPRDGSEPLNASIAERLNYLPAPEGVEIKVLSVNVSDTHQVKVVSSLNVPNTTLSYAVVRLNDYPCNSTLNNTLVAEKATDFTASFVDCSTEVNPTSDGIIALAVILPVTAIIGVVGILVGSAVYYRHRCHQ